jgi:hypothetical protein
METKVKKTGPPCRVYTMNSTGEGTSHVQQVQEERSGSYWQVWKTIEKLQVAERLHNYQNLTDVIVHILTLWANEWSGISSWQSFLNKRSFQHEVEESMVALYHFNEWRIKTKCERVVAIDVCGGKGVFSMLLQYMASLYWNEDGAAKLDSIILLEKSTEKQIDWNHLRADSPGKSIQLVQVDLWSDCNIHHYDLLLDRFQSIPHSLALTGIHLCKWLSPAMLGLVNMLGPQCQYFCLAPCCMPRVVTSKTLSASQRCVPVYQFETPSQRAERRLQLQERATADRRGLVVGDCFLCHSPDHWLRQCPLFPADADKRSSLLQEAARQAPCWNCGKSGHAKTDCPNEKPASCEPPIVELNVCNVLEESDPMPRYCELLLTTVQGPTEKVQVIETGLSNESKHQEGNWNSQRKAVYIVACRS